MPAGFLPIERIRRRDGWGNRRSGEPKRRLRIEIEEGTQYRVRSARIEGNTVYPDTEIIALLRLRPERFNAFSSIDRS
jgi:outer membrane protein assembly factor BamA